MVSEKTNYSVDNYCFSDICSKRETLESIAGLYVNVFAAPPWNEFVQCRVCGVFEGMEKSVGDSCKCGGTLTEAYPLDKTVDYILSEAKKPNFRLALVTSDCGIVGFSWSYLTSIDELVEKKWSIDENRNGMVDVLRRSFVSDSCFRYFSECGVNSNLRGLGLANKLTEAVTGPEDTVYRTNCFSPMMAVAQKIGYKQIMGPEVLIDRVSKTIVTTDKVVGRLDSENPNRTLFIKKAN